jgi:hypothetical protein
MLEALHTTELTAERSQMMHDRGHAFYGTLCGDGCEDAGKWAARRLITPRTFLEAARLTGGLDGMADKLQVLPADVCAYVSDLDPDEWLIMFKLIGRDLPCMAR